MNYEQATKNAREAIKDQLRNFGFSEGEPMWNHLHNNASLAITLLISNAERDGNLGVLKGHMDKTPQVDTQFMTADIAQRMNASRQKDHRKDVYKGMDKDLADILKANDFKSAHAMEEMLSHAITRRALRAALDTLQTTPPTQSPRL